MCWEQPEHSFLYLLFLRLILLPELAAIKLGGQIFVLFSFSLPISPMESSSSAPLCSAARPEGASEVLQDCQLAFISPCAITHSTSSVQSGDCFSAQALMPVVYKALSSCFAESLDWWSHLGREKTLWRNSRARWAPNHCCEYDPLLKWIAKHAAVLVGVNSLQHSANGAVSSGWRSLLFEILLSGSASLIWWISLDTTSASLHSNFFHASLQKKIVYLYPNSLAWLSGLLRNDIVFHFWSFAPVKEETSELGGSPWVSWC